jgi:hypothetical protein
LNEENNKKFNLVNIFINSGELWVRNITDILIIVFLGYIPLGLIFIVTTPLHIIFMENIPLRLFLIIVLFGLWLIVYILTITGVTLIATSYLKKEKINLKQILNKSISKFFLSFKTIIMAGPIILLATILLIPGIIRFIHYIFILYVVILKDLDGSEALGYSRKLVKGRWWKVFGYNFIIAVITGIIDFGLNRLFSLIPLGQLNNGFYFISNGIVTSISTIAMLLLFINLENNPLTVEINSAQDRIVRKMRQI